MIAGVCGGIGRYLRIDSSLVRLFFLLLALGDGIGLLLYVLLWIVLPEAPTADEPTDAQAPTEANFEDRAREMGRELQESFSRPHPRAGLYVGLGLIFLGLVYLVNNLNIPWLWWLDFDILWPILLILGGLVLLLRRPWRSSDGQ